MDISNRALGLSAVGIGVFALAIPIRFFTPDEYSAYAAGVQTLGLVLTLFLAFLTLRSDSVDRKVDRTLELHRELVTGEVGEARARLVAESRRTDPPTQIDRMSLSRTVLQAPSTAGSTASFEDAVALLRFFERVEATRLAGSLDDVVAASLIGSHALWWDKAILQDGGKARRPLHAFAEWSKIVAKSHMNDERFHEWGTSTEGDWGPEAS